MEMEAYTHILASYPYPVGWPFQKTLIDRQGELDKLMHNMFKTEEKDIKNKTCRKTLKNVCVYIKGVIYNVYSNIKTMTTVYIH